MRVLFYSFLLSVIFYPFEYGIGLKVDVPSNSTS